ncbi:MAG: DsbC family protein [Thiobacillaceae bacterium]
MKPFFVILMLIASFSAQADEALIRKNLAERFPKIQINQINPSPLADIYEVWAGGKLFYVDKNGDYILLGPLLNVRSQTNISQKRLEELQAIKFDDLPLNKAIKIVKGNGERMLAIFSDPECPYCKRLERELDQINNLTVYIFMYPLQTIHPHSVAIAEQIWCSSDRGQSWEQHMRDGTEPKPALTCDNPVADLIALGNKIGIDGTPTLIFHNGKRESGTLSSSEIEHLLKTNS